MKRTLVVLMAILMTASIVLVGSVHVQITANASSIIQNTIFRDDFESYTVGSFPSPQWTLAFNGNGNEYQVVVDSVSCSPTKSLQLMGNVNWAGDAVRFFNSTGPTIGYEVNVRVDNNTGIPQYGDYNDATRVGFYKIIDAGHANWYECVTFTYDGEIVASNNYDFINGHALQSYLPDQWYNIRVVVDRTNKVFSVWVNGTLEGQNLQSSSDPYDYEGFALSGRYTETTNYFDDVSIFEIYTINSTPPTIINVLRTPDTPNNEQNVEVTASVYGADESVLSYSADGVNWNNVSMSRVESDFIAMIPAQLYNITVQYEVYAYNSTIENWVESDTYSYVVAATPLSVTITPSYVEMIIGQSQTFNSTVSGGTPHYTYQWYLDYAPIPNATSDSWTFTPTFYGSYAVSLSVTDSAGAIYISGTATVTLTAPPEVYFSVDPVAVAPLTNINASINGLEIPSEPLPVGDNFTVEIHLMNATAMNVPAGVAGVEVHFYFGNILTYCKPIGFTSELGEPGGALAGPVNYAVNGFYNEFPATPDNTPLPPPYTSATQYVVAAATTTGPWNGYDGLVVKITFQITGQPSQKMNQTDFSAQLQITFGDLEDLNINEIPFSVTQGTLRIDSAPAITLVGDLNGDGKVSLADLMLLANAYGSKPGDPNWNPNADLAPPYGIVSLTDLVTLAMHYGQHYP